jgi:hypothetical protein
MKQIDSLVSIIKYSNLPTQRDSTLQDYPGLGLNMKKYTTIMTYGKDLKQYSQIVKTTRLENQIPSHEIAGSAFYYDQNKLIKVEEFLLKSDKENKIEWYFYHDKCFFYTLKSDKAEARIGLLLNLAYGFLKAIIPQQ